MRLKVRLFVVLCLWAGVVIAVPIQAPTRFDSLEILGGHVDIRSDGQAVVVRVTPAGRSEERFFKVESAGGLVLPISFSADDAQILFQKEQLGVIAPNEHRAFLFSLSGIDSRGRQAVGGAGKRGTSLNSRFEAIRRTGYDLTRMDDATALISKTPGGGFTANNGGEGLSDVFANDDYQDPGGSGGVGTCGTSCSTTCGDGSSCTATCAAPRCAHCSCPASCTCS